MAYIPAPTEPTAYAFAPDSLILDFGGSTFIIDGGQDEITFTSHLRDLNAVISTAPTKSGITNAAIQHQKYGSAVVGNLPKVKEAGTEGSSRSIAFNLQHTLHNTSSSALPLLFTPKYEPTLLYKNLARGELKVYVLSGGIKPYLDALEKAVASGNEEQIEKVAGDYGLILAFVWVPSKADGKVKRILYTGNASPDRVVEVLEASEALSLLCVPSATSAAVRTGVKLPPKVAAVRTASGTARAPAKPVSARTVPGPPKPARAPVAPITRTPVTKPAAPAPTKPASARSSIATAARTPAQRPASTTASSRTSMGPAKAAVPARTRASMGPTPTASKTGQPARAAAKPTTAAESPAKKVVAKPASSAATKAESAPASEEPKNVAPVVIPNIHDNLLGDLDTPDEELSNDSFIHEKMTRPLLHCDLMAPPPPCIHIMPATPEPFADGTSLSQILQELEQSEGYDDSPTSEQQSDLKEQTASPIKERSESPVKERTQSPVKERTQSPVEERTQSPVEERTPSPVEERTPSPVKESSQLSPGPEEAPHGETASTDSLLDFKAAISDNGSAVDFPPSEQLANTSIDHETTPEFSAKDPSEPKEDETKPEEPSVPTVPDNFVAPHVPQQPGEGGLLDDLELPSTLRRISMDTDKLQETMEGLEFSANNEAESINNEPSDHKHKSFTPEPIEDPKPTEDETHGVIESVEHAADSAAETARKISQQLIDGAALPFTSAIASSMTEHASNFVHKAEEIADHVSCAAIDASSVISEAMSDAVENINDKLKAMQSRSSIIENNGEEHKEYEQTDPVIDSVLDSVATQSEFLDRQMSTPQEDSHVPTNGVKEHHDDGWKTSEAFANDQPLHLAPVKKAKPQLSRPRYFELVTVPHKNGQCSLADKHQATEFFSAVRASSYLLAAKDLPTFVLESLLEAKKTWKSDLKTTVYPTESSPDLQRFISSNKSEMAELGLSISATIVSLKMSITTDDTAYDYNFAKIAL